MRCYQNCAKWPRIRSETSPHCVTRCWEFPENVGFYTISWDKNPNWWDSQTMVIVSKFWYLVPKYFWEFDSSWWEFAWFRSSHTVCSGHFINLVNILMEKPVTKCYQEIQNFFLHWKPTFWVSKADSWWFFVSKLKSSSLLDALNQRQSHLVGKGLDKSWRHSWVKV